MNLPFRLCLCFLEVNQDGEVWPPEFPINKGGVPTTYKHVFLVLLLLKSSQC